MLRSLTLGVNAMPKKLSGEMGSQGINPSKDTDGHNGALNKRQRFIGKNFLPSSVKSVEENAGSTESSQDEDDFFHSEENAGNTPKKMDTVKQVVSSKTALSDRVGPIGNRHASLPGKQSNDQPRKHVESSNFAASRKIETDDLESKLEGNFSSLEVYPSRVSPLKSFESLSIGDLHANPLKLLWYMIKYNMATGIDENLYSQLCMHYKMISYDYSSIRNESHIGKFIKIIQDRLVVSPSEIGKLRLIGDELGDRGRDDRLVLCILDKAHEAGMGNGSQIEEKPGDGAANAVPYDLSIVLSNHSMIFFEWYHEMIEVRNEAKKIRDSVLRDEFIALNSMNHVPRLAELMSGTVAQGSSLLSLANSMDTFEKFNTLVETVERTYFSGNTLKLIDYEFDFDGIILYTHAPYSIEYMTKLWMALGGVEEEFDDRTMFELAQSIDRLNAQFLEKMKSGEFVALMNDEWNKNPESYKPVRDDPLDYPICSIVWNRLNPEESATNSCNGYRVKYVHGHTKFSEILPTHIIGIDDNFGKGLNLKVDNEELGFCVTRRIPKECIADFIAIRDTLEPTFIKLKAIRDKNRAKHQYEVVADINESFTRIKNIIVAHLDGNIDRIHPEIKKELENLSEKIQQRKNASSGKKLFGASRSSSSWAIKELSARLDMGKLKVKSLPGR